MPRSRGGAGISENPGELLRKPCLKSVFFSGFKQQRPCLAFHTILSYTARKISQLAKITPITVQVALYVRTDF